MAVEVKREIWARNIRLGVTSILMGMRVPKKSVQMRRDGSLEKVLESSLRKISPRGRRNERERESDFTNINREKKCRRQSTGPNAPEKKNKMKNVHSIWQ